MDTPRKEFGAAVHQVRLERQVSISEMAKETAVSKQAIMKIENGQIVPRLQDFASLCRWACLDANRWADAFAYKVSAEITCAEVASEQEALRAVAS
ncbi:helix-turn-helix domain-containing protein [Burkholderia cepacia]|uniref:helix-turn-helix domain-containing protein n=1 Tax=Burkholderia cepacia TaxID=292 RepID=UPI002AB6EE94|nr:helix-turn-helix transcriptional regulator [Burkholderia cepacia]